MNTGGGFLGYANHGLEIALIKARIFLELPLDRVKKTDLFFAFGI